MKKNDCLCVFFFTTEQSQQKPTEIDLFQFPSIEGNMTDYDHTDNVMISDTEYKKMEEALMKLPVKKRKNFKYTLTDKWGVKSKVMYKDEKFYNWSLIAHKWVSIVSETEMYKNIPDNYKPQTVIGVVHVALHKFKQEYPDIDTDGIWDKLFQTHIDINHTGNHYRNHYIGVHGSVYGNYSGTH